MTSQWPTSVAESQARLHAEILAKVQSWPEDVRMDWAEMAASLEFDQGHDRAKAEQLAFWRIKGRLDLTERSRRMQGDDSQ